jgi:glycosyltransferase involved in cell wall biosynthesis
MKILLVSQEYPPETAHGGIGTQSYLKAKGLSKSGHEVFVISHSIDGNRYEQMDGDICVIRIPGMERDLPEMTLPVQWLTYSAAVAAEINRLSKRVDLDIIDFPEYGAEGFVYLLNRTELNKIPTVMQLHGPLVMLAHTLNWPDMESEFYRLAAYMEAMCFRNADRVYSSSQCSADWCLNYYYKRLDAIPVIHTGIDTVIFSPKPVAVHADPTILFVGRIAETKGVENLVEAACALSGEIPNLKLRMIGNGESRFIDKLKDKAGSCNGSKILEFVGFVEKEKLPVEFSKAHLFAAPSYYEGGPGFVYLEAMACGLPVIGCSGSGIEEIIESGKNGLLVSPKDTDALKNAIKKLIEDKGYAKMLGQEGRKYVVEHADNKLCLNKLEEFYYSMLNLL